MHRRCVLLFLRPPEREARAKRLAGAAPLFASLRDRALGAVADLPAELRVDLVIVGDPGPGVRPAGALVLPQRGRSFGERIGNAFADVRALGYQTIVAVGADAPRIEARDLAAAFAALRGHAAVLGPAPDGGVYLLGLRSASLSEIASWLHGIPWRTARVFAALAARQPDTAVLTAALPDVDGRAGLRALLALPANAGLDPALAALVRALLAIRPAFPLSSISNCPCRPLGAPIAQRGPPCLSV